MAMISSLKRKLSARQHNNDILQHLSQMTVHVSQNLKLYAIQVDCNELQFHHLDTFFFFWKEVKDLLTSLGLNAGFAILILASVGWTLT